MEMKIGVQSVPEKTELDNLIDKLSTSNEDTGEWEVVSMPMFEGLPQVIFYDNAGNRLADAVCHWESYGHEKGLIEVMGYPLCHAFEDDVEGWLTADTVFSRWMDYLAGRV